MMQTVSRSWARMLPAAILTTVLLAELVVFTAAHRDRFKALTRRHDPRLASGEGLVIRCDGLGYYAWLRSALIDCDWSFDNEFDEHNPLGDFVPPALPRTQCGHRPNLWAVGPACAWAPTVLPVHWAMRLLETRGCRWPANGYSLPYQLAIGLTTLIAGWLGLLLVYWTCQHFAGSVAAALATACVVLATPVVYYSAVEGSMAHGVGTVLLAALVALWTRTHASSGRFRWLALGLFTGACALMRWQLATFAFLPVGEWMLGWRRGQWKSAGESLERLALLGFGMALGFLPQMIAWRSVFGHWFVQPFPAAHNWWRPALGHILTSPDRGWWCWTPMTLLGCACYGLSFRRLDERLRLLMAALALQVYVVGSLWGAQVYLGAAFGFRQLTECAVVLAPALALALDHAPGRSFRLLVVLGCLCIFGNLVLTYQYRKGWIPAAAGAEPGALLAGVWKLLWQKPVTLNCQAMLWPVLIALLSHRGDSKRHIGRWAGEPIGRKVRMINQLGTVVRGPTPRLLGEITHGQARAESAGDA